MQGLKYDPKDEDSTAILDAELEGFKVRPHEKEALAAKGHVQYFVVKKGLNESTGEKKREISGKKRQQASMEEYEGIEDMIDNEEPIEKVPGRIKEPKKRKLTDDEKKAKAKEEADKREAKLQSMGKHERKEFEAKEGTTLS